MNQLEAPWNAFIYEADIGFAGRCKRLLYLIAIHGTFDEYNACGAALAQIAKWIATEAYERLGRRTCPITGQHYFAEEE